MAPHAHPNASRSPRLGMLSTVVLSSNDEPSSSNAIAGTGRLAVKITLATKGCRSLHIISASWKKSPPLADVLLMVLAFEGTFHGRFVEPGCKHLAPGALSNLNLRGDHVWPMRNNSQQLCVFQGASHTLRLGPQEPWKNLSTRCLGTLCGLLAGPSTWRVQETQQVIVSWPWASMPSPTKASAFRKRHGYGDGNFQIIIEGFQLSA